MDRERDTDRETVLLYCCAMLTWQKRVVRVTQSHLPCHRAIRAHTNSTSITTSTSYCRIYSHTSRKFWDSFAPSKSGGSTYMWVTVCQHMCHKFFQKADDVSWAWELGLKDALPVARRSAAMGHWHIPLVCVTRYCSEMNGRAGQEYSAFRAALFYRRQITDKCRTVS